MKGRASEVPEAFVTTNTVGVPQMYHWTVNCSTSVNRRSASPSSPATGGLGVGVGDGGGRLCPKPSDWGLLEECQSGRDGGRQHARVCVCVFCWEEAPGGSEVRFVPRRVVHALQHSPHHFLQVLARPLLLLQRPFHLLVILSGTGK